MATPILKWAGGKRQLLPELKRLMPSEFNTYFEPMIGGGALFFDLEPEAAFLADLNPDLISLYRNLRNEPEAVIEAVEQFEKCYHEGVDARAFFNAERSRFNERASDGPRQAARFVFLNRTCFNGLYRVNQSGGFNTPWGKNPKARILFEDQLREASEALQAARIVASEYRIASSIAKEGDFVYFDPPYVPVGPSADFTAFTTEGFGALEQQLLATHVRLMAKRGIMVMVSNADHPSVWELYKEFTIHKVSALRAINSDAKKRGAVGEVIVQAGYSS